ncbi:MAG: hypothetical protein P4L67_03480 [Candidatus Pacebacteria bacterium]|nr:hypothetical protein [Candidatus Paceibacterota bacterium]
MDTNSGQQNAIGVPPPPAEVKVRTMQSDLESMARSGGGLPQFQSVSVAGLQVEREAPGAVAAPEVAAQMAQAAESPAERAAIEASKEVEVSNHNPLGIILVVVVAVIAIAVVIYFALH